MALVTLSADVLEQVISACLIGDVHAFISCSTFLHDFGSSNGCQLILRESLVRAACSFKTPDETILRKFAYGETLSTPFSVPDVLPHEYTPQLHSIRAGDGEVMYTPVYSGKVQICFGLLSSVEETRAAVYVGRRWYHNLRLLSQPLTEEPYEGESCYTEVHTVGDLHETDVFCGGVLSGSESRPPGAKAWNGPFLKYHFQDALNDLIARTGLGDPSLRFGLTGTGFSDEGGPFVVIGAQLGNKLPSAGFDLHSQAVSFCDNEYLVEYELKPVSLDYISALVDLPSSRMPTAVLASQAEASARRAARATARHARAELATGGSTNKLVKLTHTNAKQLLDEELRGRVQKLLSGLGAPFANDAVLAYYTAFSSGGD